MGHPINGVQPGEISVSLEDLANAQANQINVLNQQLIMQAAHIMAISREKDDLAKQVSLLKLDQQVSANGVTSAPQEISNEEAARP